jgi:GntR family transcriptional regulator, transcriptional repressor for pyruvate dehydrogenase complex
MSPCVHTEQLSENLALLIRFQKISLEHLGEFREGMEGTVAALAAQRAEKKDILRLKELLEKAGACIEGGSAFRNDLLEADKQVHMDLARITGNPVYMYVLHTVHDNIYRYFDRYLSMDQRELAENYQDLCDMVAAVEKGDADSAKSLARRHVRRFSRYMQQRADRALKREPARNT